MKTLVCFLFLAVSCSFVCADNFEIADGYKWGASGCAQSDDPGDFQSPYAPEGAPPCDTILGKGVHQFSVNTELGNGCSPNGVNYFAGGKTTDHDGPNPPPNHGDWLILNTSAGNPTSPQQIPPYQPEVFQSHEMLVSNPQRSLDGWAEVEFQWHNDGSLTPATGPCGGGGSSDHVALATNVSFAVGTCSSAARCNSCDGTTQCSTADAGDIFAGAECGCTQDHTFYAVIAGHFGGNGVPNDSCGFVIEKARQYYDGTWKRTVRLFRLTHIHFVLRDNQWYKLRLERNKKTLSYTAWQWTGIDWEIIGTKQSRSFDRPHPLPPGSLGAYGYWIREGVHVDFDNFNSVW